MSLRDYAQHKNACRSRRCRCGLGRREHPEPGHVYRQAACDCGLDQALAAAPETREAVIATLQEAHDVIAYDIPNTHEPDDCDHCRRVQAVMPRINEALALLNAEKG